jgi:hypothetical protein
MESTRTPSAAAGERQRKEYPVILVKWITPEINFAIPPTNTANLGGLGIIRQICIYQKFLPRRTNHDKMGKIHTIIRGFFSRKTAVRHIWIKFAERNGYLSLKLGSERCVVSGDCSDLGLTARPPPPLTA